MFVESFYFVFFLVFCNGIPMMNEVSLFKEEKLKLTLSDGVKFGWELVEAEDSVILMKIEMPRWLTWLTIGFHKDPFKWSSDEDLALIYVKNRGRKNEQVLLRTIQYTRDGDIKGSSEHLYIMENKAQNDETHQFILLREIQTLPVSLPIKLIWGCGTERYSGLVDVFSERMKAKVITLDQPNSQAFPSPSSTTSTSETPVLESPVMSSENITEDVSTVVDDGTSKDNDNVDVDSDVDKSTDNSMPSSSNNIYVSSQKPEKLSTNLQTTSKTHTNDEKEESQQDVKTTLCTTPKCYCPTGKPSYWWEDRNNSVYMAIIGASSLFTGLLVLCLACCCGRSTRRIPKTRKHKVAFYKVDDFESGEEEIEFLKDPKEEK